MNTMGKINLVCLLVFFAGCARIGDRLDDKLHESSGPIVTTDTPLPGTASNPVFSPVAGTYINAQSVTMTSSTTGALICYSADGTTVPACSSTPICTAGFQYTAAINLTVPATFKAIACKAGLANSSVITTTYIVDLIAPADVSSLSAIGYNGKVTLTWSNPGDVDLAAVKILRKTGSYPSSYSDGTATVVFDGNGTSVDDTTISNGVTYYYKAFAYDTHGNYAPGAQTTATPCLGCDAPTQPLAFSAGSATSNKITLSWLASSDDVTSSANMVYEICRSTSSGGCSTFTATYTTTAGSANFDATGLATDTIYFFSIRAKDQNNLRSYQTLEQSSHTASITSQIANWPDTGQTNCYNDTGSVIACTGTGGAYPKQDADFAATPTTRSYTGPTQHATYTADYSTTDNATGLIWKSCTQGLSGAGCVTGSATTYNWANAKTQCTGLNAQNSGNGYAGKTNWRLPTLQELRTIVNMDTINPAITGASFPSTLANNYWTIDGSTSAFVVDFLNGSESYIATSSANYVRCVSPPSTSVTTFIDLGSGTVRDSKTNLVWQKCTAGHTGSNCETGSPLLHIWAEALNYCSTLSLAGRSWRLPSFIELATIKDETAGSPTINKTFFPETLDVYWSSTTYRSNPGQAKLFQYTGVLALNDDKTGYGGLGAGTRCVTTGP